VSIPRLHVVTDDAVLAESAFPAAAAGVMAVGGNRVALHVRGHETAAIRLFEIVTQLRSESLACGSMLFVNDRIDVAMAAGVDGVQLGHRSAPVDRVRSLWRTAVIGSSVHDAVCARRAQADGADFIVLGTIYRTTTHPGLAPAGPQLVTEVAAVSQVAVVAIGGISPDRVGSVVGAGAAGVAILSGIWRSANVGAATRDYLDALTDAIG